MKPVPSHAVIFIKHLFRKDTGQGPRRALIPGLALLGPLLLLAVLWSGMARLEAAIALADQEGQTPSEYQLKAVYLYNFLNFVHWPEERCEAPDVRPREIALVGATDLAPFRDALQALQARLHQTGKSLPVTYLGPYKEGMDLSGCRLLFISDSEKENFGRIIASVAGEPVLTVADTEEFVEAGGMIALIARQDKVRWVVNRGPAQQAGLRLNSRLLAMALRVID